MAKRLSEDQKKEILDLFIVGKSSIDNLSRKFDCSKLTITRNLKKKLGNNKYKDLIELINTSNNLVSHEKNIEVEINGNKYTQVKDNFEPSFVELTPLDYEIANYSRKELSSIPIDQIEFPKIVYMVVDKNIELEIKLLKDYPNWEFLPNEDLNRKTIEIFFDLKTAKRSCNKEQKVIKVPNTNVFKIVSPILISRGISRIVTEEKLIAI